MVSDDHVIAESLGAMGVQFWQEISNCVIRLIYPSLTNPAIHISEPLCMTVSPQFLKLYDPTWHHTSSGTSCQK